MRKIVSYTCFNIPDPNYAKSIDYAIQLCVDALMCTDFQTNQMFGGDVVIGSGNIDYALFFDSKSQALKYLKQALKENITSFKKRVK